MLFNEFQTFCILVSYFVHTSWPIDFILFSYFLDFLIEALCVGWTNYNDCSSGPPQVSKNLNQVGDIDLGVVIYQNYNIYVQNHK